MAPEALTGAAFQHQRERTAGEQPRVAVNGMGKGIMLEDIRRQIIKIKMLYSFTIKMGT